MRDGVAAPRPKSPKALPIPHSRNPGVKRLPRHSTYRVRAICTSACAIGRSPRPPRWRLRSCPNSVANCSRPEAKLFDVSTANHGGPVPTDEIAGSWRAHFYSRKSSRGPELLCPPSAWNGNAEQPPCFWAMTEASVDTVRRVWQHAPPLDVRHLVDDDDTHHWARPHR